MTQPRQAAGQGAAIPGTHSAPSCACFSQSSVSTKQNNLILSEPPASEAEARQHTHIPTSIGWERGTSPLPDPTATAPKPTPGITAPCPGATEHRRQTETCAAPRNRVLQPLSSTQQPFLSPDRLATRSQPCSRAAPHDWKPGLSQIPLMCRTEGRWVLLGDLVHSPGDEEQRGDAAQRLKAD